MKENLTGNDLTNFLVDLQRSHSGMLQAGIDSERQRISGSLDTLWKQFRMAQADLQTKIPTALSLAIEGVLNITGANQRAEDRANAYAEHAIKRDQEMPAWERDAGARDRTVGTDRL